LAIGGKERSFTALGADAVAERAAILLGVDGNVILHGAVVTIQARAGAGGLVRGSGRVVVVMAAGRKNGERAKRSEENLHGRMVSNGLNWSALSYGNGAVSPRYVSCRGEAAKLRLSLV